MAELKTKPNQQNVNQFLNDIDEARRKQDCFTILKLMKQVTKEEPKMWGNSIVGFGTYHYRYESGREGEWFLTGFSPRKHNLSLYIMSGFSHYGELLDKLGKHKTGKGCLYIKKIEDINLNVLRALVEKSVKFLSERYK
jgi:hypothetical protein